MTHTRALAITATHAHTQAMPNIQKFIQSVFALIGGLILMCFTTIYTTAIVAPVFVLFFLVARYFQVSLSPPLVVFVIFSSILLVCVRLIALALFPSVSRAHALLFPFLRRRSWR